MKHTLVSLAAAAAGSYIYMQHPQPAAVQPAPAMAVSTLPAGHHRSPDGVYYLRTAYTVPTASGSVQWTSGQTLYADRRAQATDSSSGGDVRVSDGTHSTQLLASMLSQDVEEGAALRAASAADAMSAANAARMQAQAAANRNLNGLQMAASANNTYNSPLEQGARPVQGGVVGGYYPGYGTTVVTEVRRNHEIREGRCYERFTPHRGTATGYR